MPHIELLSFGGGVQTTALAIINALVKARREGRAVPGSLHDLVARAEALNIYADEVIFADVADGQASDEWPGERPETYAANERLSMWLVGYGMSITVVSAGRLFRWAWKNRLIPATYGRGNGSRQCTHKFKIVPIQRYLRSRCVSPDVERRFKQWVGRTVHTARQEVDSIPRQLPLPGGGLNGPGSAEERRRRIPLLDRWRPDWRELAREELGFGNGRWGLTTQIGISVDEIERLKPAREWWVANRWPLVELNLHRRDCELIIEAVGLPVPPKSACEFCPLQPLSRWCELAIRRPRSFERAAQMEARCNTRRAELGKAPLYLTSTGRPLPRAVDENGNARQVLLHGVQAMLSGLENTPVVEVAEGEGWCLV